MVLQRYVIVTSTAFAGAWTVTVGALALAGNDRALRAAAGGDVWVVYPFSPQPETEGPYWYGWRSGWSECWFSSMSRHAANVGRRSPGPSRDERAALEARARKYTLLYRDVIRAKIVLLAAALGFAPAILTERPVTDDMLPLEESDTL